ncbi:N-acetylmuramoyl-L-alanine amidase [Bifidobacterium adolescentis]|uniref:N-acetylmuramoyl-L-alanine amidase n=1 Tax=Bifidobacterium adolescentis TaxID=1680 RepID=UPI0034A4388C
MDGIIWKGSPNHYTGRQGYGVTHITLHIMVGYLAGTDATFANSDSQASAHYGIGSTGEIHQYVSERDGSYSDANYMSNCSTISIEHEGGMSDGAVCTQACIDASARLCADIARRYGWKKLWHDGLKGNVWLHREIPGTDHAACPDLAPNGLPYQQVIDKANNLLEGQEMALTDEDIMKIWTHKLPNGSCVRDCLSPAIQDVFAMHDTGLTNGGWLHKLPNGRPARDIISDATSDVIRMHDALIPQLTTQITALSAAVDAMAKSLGADPDQIAEAVKKAVADKLDSLRIVIKAED